MATTYTETACTDLAVLVRVVTAHGQTPQKPNPGERAAFERLRKASLLYRLSDAWAGHYLATTAGERKVEDLAAHVYREVILAIHPDTSEGSE